MSRHVFGWSLPPGAAGHPFAPWNIEEPPCAVCGKFADSCICPECPRCGTYGDPECYNQLARELPARNEQERESGRRGHGLELTEEQIQSKAEFDEAERQAIEEENKWLDQLEEDINR